jgi:hypothetical protein
MNKRTLFAPLAVLLPVAVFAAGFEGTVTMNMTGVQPQPVPVTMSIKPGFVRTDVQMQGHSFASIMDENKHEMTMLMPEQHMYMVHAMPTADANETTAQQPEDVKIEKTNDHEKILGYDTTKYVATSKQGTTQIWATDQLGTFMGLGTNGGPSGGMRGRMNARGSGAQEWEKLLNGKPVFPLRVVTTGKDGKDTFKMEATNIEKKSLPDSLFQPPADFQKFDMGAMMRGGLRGFMPGGKRPASGDNSE